MKRILIAILAACVAAMCMGQPTLSDQLAILARKKVAASGGGATVVYSDTFTNTSGVLLPDHGSWSNLQQSMRISSDNRAETNTASGGDGISVCTEAHSENQYAQALFYSVSATRRGSLLLRCVDIDNYYYVALTNGTSIALTRRAAGVETQVDSWSIASATTVLDMRAEVTGSGSATRITILTDTGSGYVAVASGVDPGSPYLSGGAPGIRVNNSGIKVDDWESGNL